MKPLGNGVPWPIPRGDGRPAEGHEVGLFVALGGPALGRRRRQACCRVNCITLVLPVAKAASQYAR